MKKTLLILVSIFLAGCITSQRVDLLQVDDFQFSENIIIDDLRDNKSKRFGLRGGMNSCQRWYGDAFIQPSKLGYLHGALSQKYQGDSVIHIEVKQFDIVEYCDLTVESTQQTTHRVMGVMGAAVGHMASGSDRPFVPNSYLINTDPPPRKEGQLYGDFVLLEISGRINGEDFETSRAFDYSDVEIANFKFPSSSEEYRERMRIAFHEMTDEILARIATPDAQAGIEEID